MSKSAGILMCGHGTRVAEGVQAFAELSARVRAAIPDLPVVHGFLELSEPGLLDAMDGLRDQGVDEIRVVPGMLLTAGHLKNDIPAILNGWAAKNPGVSVNLGRALGVDPNMVRAAVERVEAVLDDAVPRAETALLFVGRGSSDPDANGDGAKLARLVWEGTGVAWAQTAYFDVTVPRIDAALDMTACLGFRRIVVCPYLLFTGRAGQIACTIFSMRRANGILAWISVSPPIWATIRWSSRPSSSGRGKSVKARWR